jgi:hypothetical protein
MDKVIFFENKNQKESICSAERYFSFLDYAFDCTDFFMLVFVNYHGKGYSATMNTFKKELEPFTVKTRSNPSWPGTPSTYSINTTYKVIFYRTDPKAKTILKKVTALNDWSSPSYPQDLAFFKGNKCWFYSVGHEKIAAIIRPTNNDLDFMESYQFAQRINVEPLTDYYRGFDECFTD